MILKIVIFVLGLAGSSYPVKGEVTTPALSFISHEINLVTMEEEVWKEIPGYEGYYEVSNTGKVRRINVKTFYNKKGKERSVSIHRDGYVFLGLTKGGVRENYFIHRLVAQAFIPNPENKPQVNHINSVRSDNRVENLEWVTISENMIHGYKYGNVSPTSPYKGKFGKDHFASKAILQMNDDGEVLNEFVGIGYAAKIMGIPQSSISKCCLGQLKHAGGYVWKYKDV